MVLAIAEKVVRPDEGAKLTQHLGALTASLAALTSGMAMGWTSAAEPVAAEKAQGFAVTSEEWSWVGSVLTLGAALGSIPVGALLQALGRRKVALALAPLMLVAWLLHLFATAVWMLIVGRALMGLAVGATCVVVPIYAGEIAERSVRGALGSYFELLLCVGILVVYTLGTYLTVFWVNVACCVVPLVYGVCFMCFPDTPRWLLSRGRREDARRSLVFYRGKGYDVDAELDTLDEALKARADEATGLRAFATVAAKRGLMLSVGSMVFQQVSGIDAVTFYASQIFKDAGSSLDANMSSVVVGIAEIVATAASLLLVDRLGRRFLLLFSAAVMAICLALLGAYFHFMNVDQGIVSTLGWAPVVLAAVYVFTFSLGFGPVPWLLTGEIFPDQIKGVASSIANISNWMCAFLVTKFFTTVNETLGLEWPFWMFCCAMIVAFVFVFTLMPETKGKTLDEIQDELSGRAGRPGKKQQTIK